MILIYLYVAYVTLETLWLGLICFGLSLTKMFGLTLLGLGLTLLWPH